MKYMPQEIEVWYLLPALRKEIAKELVENHGLRQKEVAAMLDITEAAVSQYLKHKRGKGVAFSPKEYTRIKEAAALMLKNKKQVPRLFYELSATFRGSSTLCQIHKGLEDTAGCTICKGIKCHYK